MTPQDGKGAIEMVLAVYESGALAREMELPLNPDDPVYQRGVAGPAQYDVRQDNAIIRKNILNVRNR